MEPVTVIIPVKDEEDGLKYLLDDFRNSSLYEKHPLEFIFVIDERTSDMSRSIAMEFSDRIIDQNSTRGKGAAIKQAVDLWKENPTPIVVFLDADGSYSFSSVRQVIETITAGAEVVSGSRFIKSNGRPIGMTRLHNFGNKILSKVSSLKNRRRISDLCTGLWGFSSNALLSFDIKSNGFDLEAELAGLTRKSGFSHVEIPVEWSQRKGGTSKLRSLTDGFIIFLRILRT